MAGAGRWEEAIALAEEFGFGAYNFFDSLLSKALNHGAPMDSISDLIERNGGKLPEGAILILARAGWDGAADVATILERDHGLNLHFVDDQGRNAMSAAVERFYDFPRMDRPDADTLRMVTYLMDRLVSAKPSARGFDPLDIVLLEMVETPLTGAAGTLYVRLLLDYGAPIELSHRQLAAQLRSTAPDAYRYLIERVPELAT